MINDVLCCFDLEYCLCKVPLILLGMMELHFFFHQVKLGVHLLFYLFIAIFGGFIDFVKEENFFIFLQTSVSVTCLIDQAVQLSSLGTLFDFTELYCLVWVLSVNFIFALFFIEVAYLTRIICLVAILIFLSDFNSKVIFSHES